MGEQVRQQRVPVIGDGQGVWSWVHVDDAAAATAAALECPPGIFNVVDANPTVQEEALAAFGPDTVYYATRLRGASNEKAKRELNFHGLAVWSG